jgi:hypothetical protein
MKMAPAFTPDANVAQGCILDAIENRPLEALQMFESAATFVAKERRGKHFDVVAMSHLISASICRRHKLTSMHHAHPTKSVLTLRK